MLIQEIEEIVKFIEENIEKLNVIQQHNFYALRTGEPSLELEKQFLLLRNVILYGDGEEKLEKLSI